MLEQLERQLFSASQSASPGFCHPGIRSDGGRRAGKRQRNLIREQDREDEVQEDGKDGGKKANEEKREREKQRRGKLARAERQFELKII